jgi:nucleotide-binding universal stress UspA family protein
MDFSTCAERAWDLALRLTVANGGELVLTHILSEAPSWSEGTQSMDRVRHVLDSAREWVEAELERRAADARTRGVTVRVAVRSGSPWQEIVDLASDEQADLVILGTHGRGGLGRALLGSVADRVVRMAPCPVLTVREPAP